MTVAELIENLKRLDQGMQVLTPGFDESGFDDIVVSVRRMGEYRLHDPSKGTYVNLFSADYGKAESAFDAVVISFDY